MTSLRALPLLCILSLASPALAADIPSQAAAEANWPRFRGPGGNGVCAKGTAPLDCDLKTGANVAWVAPVPAPGFSSPVVWGDRVFLSGGDKSGPAVMAFDAATGRLAWHSRVPKTAAGADEKADASDQSGIASSTVATDGLRVYAMFANGDLAAFRFDGTVAWAKSLGRPKNPYGHATSLLTWGERVIVQFDQGEADDHLSKLCAFEGATGALAWEQSRPVGASWATPITLEAAGRSQIITLGVPWVISYAPADGKELWRADCLDGEVTPSPVFAGGTLFVVHPTSKLQSIRPDGAGDVTATHLGWTAEDGIPDIASPVSNRELVFLVDSSGTLTCYDLKDGRKQWTHDLEEEVNASPSLVGDRLYLVTKKGVMIVVAAAREFKELARSDLGEPVLASPAFARDRIFVRGSKHLLCIGAKQPGS